MTDHSSESAEMGARAPLFPHAPLSICTTLNRLRKANACAEGFAAFKRHLKANYPHVGDDDPVPLTIACDSNSAAHVLWAMRDGLCEHDRAWRDRLMREMACDFAEHVLPIFEKKYPNDDRPRKAIEVARRFARGEASDYERRQARSAAYAAAAAAYAAAERQWQKDRLRAALLSLCDAPRSSDGGIEKPEGGRASDAEGEDRRDSGEEAKVTA